MEERLGDRSQVLQSTSETAARVTEISAKEAETTSLAIDHCVICLENVSERAVASPCQHYSFDFLCLISWLQERATCPLCNAEVHKVEYDWQGPNNFKTYVIHSVEERTSPISRAFRDRTRRPRVPNRTQRYQRPVIQPSPDVALLRRRYVYRNQTYSLHVGSNRLSRFQDLTPRKFSSDEELISRARKWIRRELQVFEFLSSEGREEGATRRANNAEFLLEYVIAILKTVDVKGSSGQAEDMLQEYLGRDNTQLFLHELRAWLRSPFMSLEDWDRNVQYVDVSHEPCKDGSKRAAVHEDEGRGYLRRAQPDH